MNLSWFVGFFFGGAGLGIDFGAQKHTTWISPRKRASLKGNSKELIWQNLMLELSDHFGEDSHAHFWGDVRKKRRNFHRRMTIGIHMLGLVECWQIFHGSRPTVCSEKESHQKGICNPWNLCWTCKIHTIREAIFGFPPFCSNGLFPPLLFSAIAHEFPLAACGHGPFFGSLPPWQSVLAGGSFWVPCPCGSTTFSRTSTWKPVTVSSVVQRRSVIDVFIHRDGAR